MGNWAGVTVDKKENPIKKNYYNGLEELIAVDLPGAYSMSPFTSEESITRDYVKNEHPDVIINEVVKDASIKRALFSMLERGKAYIVKAGTIILICNTVVQIMQSFNWQFQLVEEGMEAALQFATGYVTAFLVYQIGTLTTTGTVGTGFLPGIIIVAAIVGVVLYLIKREKIDFEKRYIVWQILL